MKIIEDSHAPNPRRVRVFLAEKNIAMNYEQVDIMAGETKTAEFSALNPLKRVPVLVLDDGTVITETVAICRYFEELHPDPALFGVGALERARIEMWHRRMELGLFFSVAQTFRHLHPAMEPLEVPQVAAWGEANRPRVGRMLELANEQLANHAFIAGDTFSIADITALVAIDFMKPARVEYPTELAHVTRWHEDVRARPSAKA